MSEIRPRVGVRGGKLRSVDYSHRVEDLSQHADPAGWPQMTNEWANNEVANSRNPGKPPFQACSRIPSSMVSISYWPWTVTSRLDDTMVSP